MLVSLVVVVGIAILVFRAEIREPYFGANEPVGSSL